MFTDTQKRLNRLQICEVIDLPLYMYITHIHLYGAPSLCTYLFFQVLKKMVAGVPV